MDNPSPKTILIVEDSRTQAFQLQTLLEKAGAFVVCAVDGPTGLAAAQRVHPDAIILDVQLPGMDGFEVCQHLKDSPALAHIPVIMFTRHDTPEAVLHGLQQGVVDYIPKDAFANAVLLETLRQMGLLNHTDAPDACADNS